MVPIVGGSGALSPSLGDALHSDPLPVAMPWASASILLPGKQSLQVTFLPATAVLGLVASCQRCHLAPKLAACPAASPSQPWQVQLAEGAPAASPGFWGIVIICH